MNKTAPGSGRVTTEPGNCSTCRYWSEMVARVTVGGPVQAMCLAPDGSPNRGQYTAARNHCAAWTNGAAIDAPR